jgi:TolB-like protein
MKVLNKIILFLILASYFPAILSDEVTLKNEKIIEKVKVKISIDKVTVIYLDNKTESFLKKEVKSVRIKPIIITNPVTEKEKKENEKEKIRAAESLQNLTGLEIQENQKLKLAVLNFKSSANITKEEADIIVETITVELVKTKLFIIADPILVKQVMDEKGGKGCGESPSNCKLPATEIAKSIQVSKIITGTINKIKNSYYVSGNVIDTSSKNIDFAESSIATSFDKIPETSENFSKKVAGGLMSISKTEINLNQESQGFFSNLLKSNSDSKETRTSSETISRMPYVWRSALVPGWGQIANDRKLKGFSMLGLFALGVGFEFNSYKNYKSSIDEYKSAGDNFILNTYLTNMNASNLALYLNTTNTNSQREQIDLYEKQLEAGAGFLAVLYLYNLFDAYYFAKNPSQSVLPSRDFSPKFSAIPTRTFTGEYHTQYNVSLEINF